MISKFEIHNQIQESNYEISFYDVVSNYLKIQQLDNFVFIDGGAGIGKVGNKVKEICELQNQASKIHLVEPLPENVQVLNQHYNIKDYKIHPVALSNINGEATFAVPNRRKNAHGKWPKNSSTGGTLANDKNIKENIKVKTVRLEDIVQDKINILKLDLQGGEYNALQGFSSRLKDVDIIYIEHAIRRNLEKILAIIPDNFELVFDTIMGGLVGKVVPLNVMRADGIELDTINIGLFGQNAIVRGHFSDTRWDISKWETEQKLLNNIKRYKLSWLALDAFLINKNLKNKELLFK